MKMSLKSIWTKQVLKSLQIYIENLGCLGKNQVGQLGNQTDKKETTF